MADRTLLDDMCRRPAVFYFIFSSISHLLAGRGAVILSVGAVSGTAAVACDGKPPAAHVLTKTNHIPTIYKCFSAYVRSCAFCFTSMQTLYGL